jgi:competence protein ComEC
MTRSALKLALVALVLALATAPAWPAASQLCVSVVDVGQGDSILVQFPNGQNMLVDAGDEAAGPTVVRHLRSRGIERIDILVATHPHADHIGGMQAVMTAFAIGKVWDSGYAHGSRTQERFLQVIRDRGIRFGRAKSGFSEAVGGVTVQVLAPPPVPVTGAAADANNSSVVLRLGYGEVSFLLAGDMEREERATRKQWPRSTVLKVAHHGSENGTDPAFARQVSPRFAVISCAQENPYGHPHQETLKALEAAGARVLCTSTDGTVTFTTDGHAISYTTTRAEHRAAQMTGDEQYYIGSARSHVFHRPSCRSLPVPKNRVRLSSREEAIAEGYQPCPKCSP